jgi:hypothetical protein
MRWWSDPERYQAPAATTSRAARPADRPPDQLIYLTASQIQQEAATIDRLTGLDRKCGRYTTGKSMGAS